MQRLSDLTRDVERIEDAHAFFLTRTTLGLARDAATAMMQLRGKLDGPRYRDLEAAQTRKTAVDPFSTFGDPSLAEPIGWQAAFLALVQQRTALDNVGIRAVPFNAMVPIATESADFDWVGEGLAAPVTRMTFASAPLTPTKIAGVRAVTRELLTTSNPRVQGIVEADSQRALAIAVDRCAFDPDRAAVSDVSPASLTYGATEVTGTSNYEADAANLLAAVSGGHASAPYFVMNRRLAIVLASLRLTSGQAMFPMLGVMGGAILGVPAVIGLGVPDVLVALDGDRILLGDGAVTLDVTTEADLQMSDAPSSGGQAMVSGWQSNVVGLKCTRYLSWQAASDATAFRRVDIGGSPE